MRASLADGTFHAASVEDLADRAGVSRATMYAYFPSRLALTDEFCRVFAVNPALMAIRHAVVDPDPRRALDDTIRLTVAFWSSEAGVLGPLYDTADVDPSAGALVVRQRADRRSEMRRLIASLTKRGRTLPDGALASLMLLTSFDTYRELRRERMTDDQIVGYLQKAARRQLES